MNSFLGQQVKARTVTELIYSGRCVAEDEYTITILDARLDENVLLARKHIVALEVMKNAQA